MVRVALVHWHVCALTRGYTNTWVHWHVGALTRDCTGTCGMAALARWFTGTWVHWHVGALARGCIGSLLQWRVATLASFNSPHLCSITIPTLKSIIWLFFSKEFICSEFHSTWLSCSGSQHVAFVPGAAARSWRTPSRSTWLACSGSQHVAGVLRVTACGTSARG